MLLGIGPKPDGTLPLEAVAIMEEIGEWLDRNGEAIYNTRAMDFHNDGETYFMQNGRREYALVHLHSGTSESQLISWKGNLPKEGSKMKLLATGREVDWAIRGNEVQINLPKKYHALNAPALVFSFE